MLKSTLQRTEAMSLLQRIISNINGTLDTTKTLELTLRGALELTGMSSGVVHLVDEIQQKIISSYEIPKDFGYPTPRLLQEKDPIYEIINTSEIIAISDIAVDTDINSDYLEKGIRSFIGSPLITGKKAIGVLLLSSSEPHGFSPQNIELLSILVSNAATAIHNAQLFELQKHQTETIELLQQIAAQINSRIGGEDVLSPILEGALRLTGMSSGVIHLIDEMNQSVIRSFEFPKGFGHPVPRLSQEAQSGNQGGDRKELK